MFYHTLSKMELFMTRQVLGTKAWVEVTAALETGVAVPFFLKSAITAFSCITINTLHVPNCNELACSPWSCFQSEVRTNELSGPQEEDKDVEAEGKGWGYKHLRVEDKAPCSLPGYAATL